MELHHRPTIGSYHYRLFFTAKPPKWVMVTVLKYLLAVLSYRAAVPQYCDRLSRCNRSVFKLDELGVEIARIAVPAALALTADPIASLVDTAFIGQLGSVELAAVGVSIAVFNQVSRIAIFPLVSVTTSFVAEEDTIVKGNSVPQDPESFDIGGSTPGCESNKLIPQNGFTDVKTRIAVLCIEDTKTPLFATVVGDLTNIILDPIFIFVLGLGVRGAAHSHIIFQYLISVILFWRLVEKVDLIPPSLKDLQFARFLKNGFLLLMRVIAVTFCVTLAASLAARLGPTQMAAFQVCLQVWLATSLLADGLAVAGQAILATAFAKNEFSKATSTASRVLQLLG
ncbi:unnamed protein product [Cuscuta campestris]|uniref:Protein DETOXIFICATION n=1 Tax=Cuscuta campestris TaxID=132261 RepID=A0A484N330_9ASTE|nr:unnamed protein product [Cuscuta campestris]